MIVDYHRNPLDDARDAIVALGIPAAKAQRLVTAYRSPAALANATAAELRHAGGLTERQAERVTAAFRLARVVSPPASDADRDADRVHNPEGVVDFLRRAIAHETAECFVVIMLDSRHRVIDSATVHRGSISQVDVHPREVFAGAIRCGAHSLIVAHNHPSGHQDPSQSDIDLTRRLVDAGHLVGIPVLDHVIVTVLGHTSLAALGLVGG